MKWRWDLRPPEFVALPKADRKRVWKYCYNRSLRRPRMLVPVMLLGVLSSVVNLLVQAAIGKHRWTWPWLVVRALAATVVLAVLVYAFARYIASALYDELRACATSCCLNCWYDLTGNESGVCPECGTKRRRAA